MSDLSFMGGFNAAEIEDLRDDTPLPDGHYYLEVEKMELKQTANGQGTGANAQFDCLGEAETGAMQGRKVFNWFNLQHSNDTAQKIGQAEFASLCKAVGVMTPRDTDELIGKRFIAKIGIDKKDNTKNVIKKYLAIEGEQPSQQSAPSTPAPKPAQPTTTTATSKPTPPWMRK